MLEIFSRRILRIFTLLAALIVVSSAGYMIIEDASLIEAAYMTMITLSTVGFREVIELSDMGRIFTIFVIIAGVGTGAYLFSSIAEYFIAGELAGTLRTRKMMNKIKKINKHYIVCGYGRIGEHVARELNTLKLPFVVIDLKPEALEKCENQNFLYIEGDATEDSVLMQAGIERAEGFIAALSDDSNNVFAVLTARALNPTLKIASRATNEAAERKLEKAGADKVITPYRMAGYRIVSQLRRPNVLSFVDMAMRSQSSQLWLEEISISENSSLVGKSLVNANIRVNTGANVLSIMRGDHGDLLDWTPDLKLLAGDILIVLGNSEQLGRLANLADYPLQGY